MRLILTLVAVLTLYAQVTVSPQVDREELALQAAIRTETVDGDLGSAIRRYEAITKSGNRRAAAQSYVRLGRCHQKLGDAQAKAAFERVIQDYPDQQEAVREARKGLVTMSSHSEAAPAGEKIGWYNGDWCHCAKGLRNQVIEGRGSALVYDDFVVPSPGWTVTGVFSNDYMRQVGATQAHWEIRSGMSEGHGGKVVASKTSPAKITPRTPVDPDGYAEFEVSVEGLNVKLQPGRYWLAVAPVCNGRSYINATSGKNAVGDPPGNNALGYTDFPELHERFIKTEDASAGVHDSSQGVRIATEK
jgi:hypothetical protein